MSEAKRTLAEEIARAAIAFQRACTGRTPESASVLLGEKTLVVTLHEALSPAEKELSRTSEGAARVQEYHRQLFHDSSAALHDKFRKILGVEIRESAVDVGPESGRVVETFSTGDLVQVFRFSSPVAAEAWSSTKTFKAPPPN